MRLYGPDSLKTARTNPHFSTEDYELAREIIDAEMGNFQMAPNDYVRSAGVDPAKVPGLADMDLDFSDWDIKLLAGTIADLRTSGMSEAMIMESGDVNDYTSNLIFGKIRTLAQKASRKEWMRGKRRIPAAGANPRKDLYRRPSGDPSMLGGGRLRLRSQKPVYRPAKPSPSEIRLRRISGNWRGETIDDSDLLAFIGAPRYFPDERYDEVLRKAGSFGITLATPVEEYRANPTRKDLIRWMASELTNDEASSDDEMARHFVSEGGISLETAKDIIARLRGNALHGRAVFRDVRRILGWARANPRARKYRPGDIAVGTGGGGLSPMEGEYVTVVRKVPWRTIEGSYKDPGPRAVYFKRKNGTISWTHPQYLHLVEDRSAIERKMEEPYEPLKGFRHLDDQPVDDPQSGSRLRRNVMRNPDPVRWHRLEAVPFKEVPVEDWFQDMDGREFMKVSRKEALLWNTDERYVFEPLDFVKARMSYRREKR